MTPEQVDRAIRELMNRTETLMRIVAENRSQIHHLLGLIEEMISHSKETRH